VRLIDTIEFLMFYVLELALLEFLMLELALLEFCNFLQKLRAVVLHDHFGVNLQRKGHLTGQQVPMLSWR
jgi:hypothetical protein